MGVTRGPQYPGIEDGLIFCFDPKNPTSYKGGDKLYSTFNTAVSGSEGQNEAIIWSEALTSEGSIELDGTDDFLYVSQEKII